MLKACWKMLGSGETKPNYCWTVGQRHAEQEQTADKTNQSLTAEQTVNTGQQAPSRVTEGRQKRADSWVVILLCLMLISGVWLFN